MGTAPSSERRQGTPMKLFDRSKRTTTQPAPAPPVRPFDPEAEVQKFRNYVTRIDTIAKREQTQVAYDNDRLYARGGISRR